MVLPYINMNCVDVEGIHVSPPGWNPLPPHLPSRLSQSPFWCPASYIKLHWFFHMWQCICFHAILSNHPTLSLSHWVQKSVLYVMFPLSSSCKLEPWWCRVIFGSTVHQTYLGCTSANGSEPLPTQKSWRTNTYFIRTLERLKRIDLCIKSPKRCPEQNKNVQGSKWLKVKWSTFCYHTLGGEQLISIFLFLARCGSLT